MACIELSDILSPSFCISRATSDIGFYPRRRENTADDCCRAEQRVAECLEDQVMVGVPFRQ
jgi:hypothetical protein